MHLDDPNGHLHLAVNWFQAFRETRLKHLESKFSPAQIDYVTRQTKPELPPFYPLVSDQLVVLHVAPASACDPLATLDLPEGQLTHSLRPLFFDPHAPAGHHYNAEGFVSFMHTGRGTVFGYAQLFRNGVIELVDGSLLSERTDGKKLISPAYEHGIVDSAEQASNLLRTLSVEGPQMAALSIIGASGYLIQTRGPTLMTYAIAQDSLQPAPVVFDSPDAIRHTFRPIFDAIWQAGGRPRSLNYDPDGNWTGQAVGQ